MGIRTLVGSWFWEMGEDQHSESNSPFKANAAADRPAENSSAPKAESPLNQEVSTLLTEKQKLIKESESRTEYPGLNAMAARGAYYGIQGRLFPNMGQITSVMLQSGPVGEAAVQRMQALSEKGWKFGALSVSDPYIANHAKSPLGKLGFTIVSGGYNDAISGKIAHNSFSSFVNTVMGMSNGADRDAAAKYMHELAHGKYTDGYLKYEGTAEARTAFKDLPEEVRRTHGLEMVREELRAVSAQVAASAPQPGELWRSTQTKGLANAPFEVALKQGQMGAMVKDVWLYEGSKAITHAEANAAVKEYIRTNYGGELFENGKLSQRAQLAIAREIGTLPLEAPKMPGLQAATAETAFSAPRYFNYLSRGAQAAGSLMALNAAGDIRNQFNISTGSGIARLSSVGTDWAFFEAGAAAGGHLGEGVAKMLVKSNPRIAMLALPIMAIGTGIVGAQIGHTTISKPMELNVKKSVDDYLEKR